MGGSFPKYINNVGGFFSAVGQTFCYKTHFTKAFLPARHLAAAGVVCASAGVCGSVGKRECSRVVVLECVGVLKIVSVCGVYRVVCGRCKELYV